MRNLIRDGIPKDMLDNGSVEQIAHQLAFAKSQRARFGQDNVISSAKSEWIAKLNNKKHHLTADILDAAMPIVKIGSNYVGETLEKYPLIGLIPNGKNMFKSSDLLTSKQQSDLLRTLAYQGVGTMSFLAGAMLYKNISAFFGTDADEYAKKQNPHLAEHDGAIGFLSHLYSHSPDAEAMRIGASFMWYWDMYDKKNNGDKEPMSDLMMATFENTLGVVNQSPYITTAENTISPLLDSKKDGGKVGANFVRPRLPFGDFAKTIAQGQIPILDKVSPELGNEIAKKLGMNPETVKPYEIGLRPKGFIDNFGIGIPGWRDKILKDIYNEKYNTPKEPKSGEEYQQSQQDKQDKEYKKQQFQNEH